MREVCCLLNVDSNEAMRVVDRGIYRRYHSNTYRISDSFLVRG
jgi:hypothetical protein